jgi:hypothetical protein
MDETLGGKRSKYSDSDILENRYKREGGGGSCTRERRKQRVYI